MARFLRGVALAVTVPSIAWAQPSASPGSLLEQVTGRWVLEGTIAGKPTTHEVVASWVLDRQYVELHEVSLEKDATGRPAYEAIVYLAWEVSRGEYSCLWLDSTGNGGLSGQAVGHAKPSGDEIRLLFKAADGSTFHTTFAYNRSTDTWQWQMDGEEGGQLVPFARVTLRRE
jgi:hypothetical protein